MSNIKILTPTEIRNYEMPPKFDSFQRKKFFTLPIGLMEQVESLRTSSGKIAFVVQAGYFRSSQRFFGNSFNQTDIAFVAGRLDLPIPNFQTKDGNLDGHAPQGFLSEKEQNTMNKEIFLTNVKFKVIIII